MEEDLRENTTWIGENNRKIPNTSILKTLESEEEILVRVFK